MRINPARLFGIFFILSFVTYATGIGLMEIIQNTDTLPGDIMENKVSLVIGAVLIAIFHTLFNLGLIVVIFGILKLISRSLSVTYLVFGCFATLMLALGAVFLLLPIPVSEVIDMSNNMDISYFSLILNVSSGGNFYLYQIGMVIWGFGGLILCYLLYKAKLVPVLFPIWGIVGYSIFVGGCTLELFGFPYGVVLSVPGGLFEISLSTWLIIKGFNNVLSMAKISS